MKLMQLSVVLLFGENLESFLVMDLIQCRPVCEEQHT